MDREYDLHHCDGREREITSEQGLHLDQLTQVRASRGPVVATLIIHVPLGAEDIQRAVSAGVLEGES